MSANPWRPIAEAPKNGAILEGVNSNGIMAHFSLEYEPQGEEVTRNWWGREKTKFRPGRTFMYLALPNAGGYSRLSSRTDWWPVSWRYLRLLEAEDRT